MANQNKFGAVAKRFGLTAREVRDIATALGTSATAANIKAGSRMKSGVKANLKQQIQEVGTAATKGKKGTTSAKFETSKKTGEYTFKYGKKRK
jgi:hypothetical protein